MTQPTWNTPAGSIGTYIVGAPISYQFDVSPSVGVNTIVYELLNGNFPSTGDINNPMSLSASGLLTGTPNFTEDTVTTSFTIRATEYSGAYYIGFRDRTFSITVNNTTIPVFSTSSGSLGTIEDSTWTSIQLSYTYTNTDDVPIISVFSGELPPGLEINSSGLIRGYATPPTDSLTSLPVNKTYSFILQITGSNGYSTTSYEITVNNQELLPGYTGRNPTILNNRPLSYTISPIDPYAAYYVADSSVGQYDHDNVVAFKIIGYDFQGDALDYTFTSLPPGLTGYSTGWIEGTLPAIGSTITTYTFTAKCYKISDPSKQSPVITFTMTVVGDVVLGISWQTLSDLGTIYNGQVSTFAVEAVATGGYGIQYSLVSGSLPPNLTLQAGTGEITGRIPFQPMATLSSLGDTEIYSFTIQATCSLYPSINSSKEFQVILEQRYTIPYDNIYIKAMPSVSDVTKINSLLANTTIIPTSSLYRPTDIYFGKAQNVVYQHMFGVYSSDTEDYIAAVQRNHYNRQLTLGEIKTATAYNDAGEPMYEVVYSQIVDDLVNAQNISISKSVRWPVVIEPEDITVVYPASLPNMRQQVSDTVGMIRDLNLIPRWMLGLEISGISLGPIPAWVICYTKVGQAATIANNINTLWPYKLNEIQFQIDRFEVDKTLSYQYNTSTETWSALPSGVKTNDTSDVFVYFPLTILS